MQLCLDALRLSTVPCVLFSPTQAALSTNASDGYPDEESMQAFIKDKISRITGMLSQATVDSFASPSGAAPPTAGSLSTSSAAAVSLSKPRRAPPPPPPSSSAASGADPLKTEILERMHAVAHSMGAKRPDAQVWLPGAADRPDAPTPPLPVKRSMSPSSPPPPTVTAATTADTPTTTTTTTTSTTEPVPLPDVQALLKTSVRELLSSVRETGYTPPKFTFFDDGSRNPSSGERISGTGTPASGLKPMNQPPLFAGLHAGPAGVDGFVI